MHVIRAGGATLQNPPVFVDRKAAKGSKSVVSNSVTLKETERSNLPLTIPILHEMVCRNHPQLKVSGALNARSSRHPELVIASGKWKPYWITSLSIRTRRSSWPIA